MASTLSNPDVSSNGEEKNLYTIETLVQHKSRESLWMLLHDKVYDVTKFMDEHPGGDEVLLEESGRDATEAFEDVGHSDEARAMLPKMYLGEFKGEKKSKAKKAVTNATGAVKTSSGSGLPGWILPVGAIIAAYLAWRFLYA